MNLVKVHQEIITLIKSQTNIINSNQTFRKYVEKCQKNGINNEENVVQPFTLSFLKILNYINQHNLESEEVQKGNKPDFHSDLFILECKSSKYRNFKDTLGREESPEQQLKRYLESEEFSREFGMIFSLEKLQVYKLIDGELKPLPNLSFSLVDFLENKDNNIDQFIKRFFVKPITTEEKIRIIANTQKEDLISIYRKNFNTILKSLVKEISIELNTTFTSLDKKDDDAKLITTKICQIKKQMDLASTDDAEQEYISQTSYIIMARILLTKCWEDLELIDPPNTYIFLAFLVFFKFRFIVYFFPSIEKVNSTDPLFSPRLKSDSPLKSAAVKDPNNPNSIAFSTEDLPLPISPKKIKNYNYYSKFKKR